MELWLIIVGCLILFGLFVYLRIRQTEDDLTKCTEYFGENLDKEEL